MSMNFHDGDHDHDECYYTSLVDFLTSVIEVLDFGLQRAQLLCFHFVTPCTHLIRW